MFPEKEKLFKRGTNWIDDKAGRLHDWSVRNLDGRFGAVGSFIRGMAPDALVGVGTLVSEGTKTITAGVREAKKSGAGLTGSTRTQAMATSFAEMIGAGVGGIIGGTARGAKEDPIAFAGGLIGTGGAAGIGKLGSGIGRFRFKMFKETRGLTHTPIEKIADPMHISYGQEIFVSKGEARISNMHRYGTEKVTLPEAVSLLKNAKNKYPGHIENGKSMIIHATPTKFDSVASIKKGASGEPGLFGAHEGVIYFLKVPHFKIVGAGFSNPFKKNKFSEYAKNANPRFMFIENRGIRNPPADVYSSRTKTIKFLNEEANANYAYTTHKMKTGLEAGKYAEIEAVIPPVQTIIKAGEYMGKSWPETSVSKATVHLTELNYKTTVKQPVTIFGIRFGLDLPIPIEKRTVVTADDMALVPVSAPTKKSRFFSPDSKGKDGSLTYPVGTNMNLQATPAKAVKNVTEISRKNGSIKEMFAARRTVSSEVSERHKTGMASKIYDSKKMFEPTESIKPIASANSSTAARISRLTAGNEAIKPKASSTQNLNNLLHNKKPQKTKTKKSDSGNSSRKSSKTATYPIVDLTFSAPSIARGSAAKSEGYVTGYSSDEYSAAPSRGFGKSVKKSAYSSTGSSKSGFKAETAKTTAARPIKKVEKKVKKEETTASVKRTKKTAKRKTEREFRINPLKGLKI